MKTEDELSVDGIKRDIASINRRIKSGYKMNASRIVEAKTRIERLEAQMRELEEKIKSDENDRIDLEGIRMRTSGFKESHEILDEISWFDSYDGKVYQETDILDCMKRYANQFKPKWISIDEREPEIGEEVLLKAVKGAYGVGKRYAAEDEISYWEIPDYAFPFRTKTWFPYWMPIPKD